MCKIKTKINRNLSTYFSLDGKNIILYYSIKLTNLACTGYFQVIFFFYFMTNGHEILHIRVKLSDKKIIIKTLAKLYESV